MKGIFSRMNKFIQSYLHLPIIKRVAIFLVALAILFVEIKYLEHGRPRLMELLKILFTEFSANLVTEFLSISATILIIDEIYQRRSEENEKEDLCIQMTSPDNSFALEAVRKLIKRSWLGEALHKTDIECANLRGVNFNNMKLEDINFSNVILANSKMSNCKLQGSKFTGSDLTAATLVGANLRETDFQSANLTGANLASSDFQRSNLQNANSK